MFVDDLQNRVVHIRTGLVGDGGLFDGFYQFLPVGSQIAQKNGAVVETDDNAFIFRAQNFDKIGGGFLNFVQDFFRAGTRVNQNGDIHRRFFIEKIFNVLL